MTRVEYTKSKTRAHNQHHDPGRPERHQQQKQQQNSMRRQLRWRAPSIVLLLASCLVFCVVFSALAARCSRLAPAPPPPTPRPTMGAHYNLRRSTIIRTRESMERGASFINYTLVTSLNACLVECWITDNCDTAIYQESPVDYTNHLPYLINASSNKQQQQLQLRRRKEHQISHNVIPAGDLEAEESAPRAATAAAAARGLSAASASLSRLLAMTTDDDSVYRLRVSSRSSRWRRMSDKMSTYTTAPPPPPTTTTEDKDAQTNEIGDDQGENEADSDRDAGGGGDDEATEDAFSEEDQEEEELRAGSPDAVSLADDMVSLNLIDPQEERAPRGFFICYLFQCAKPDGFKCQFSAHNYYVSATSRRVGPARAAYTRTFAPPPFGGEDTTPAVGVAGSRGPPEEVEFDDSRPLVWALHQEPRYSNIVNGQQRDPFSHTGRSRPWTHESHLASIKIGQEDHERYDGGGLNSAIIALLIGVCATGILIMIVGHKMKTIRKKIAYKGRRRSLVPDADFLINTLPS